MRAGMGGGLSGRRTAIGCLLLVLATLAVYAPLGGHDFVDYDDQTYVTRNPLVQDGLAWPAMREAFISFRGANWHPLAWLSHMTDVTLFGMRPGYHHLSSLVLHAAAAVLLFLALRGLTGAVGPSLFTALLFALHPLHVESVAWISERKDVLLGLCFMLTLLGYLRYLRKPTRVHLAAVTGLYVLALTAKPMGVTLPFVLLLLDWWPLGRAGAGVAPVPWPRLLREKIPLFLLAAASGVVTYAAQARAGAVQSWERFSLPARAANALIAYGAYLEKMALPRRLAFFYPRPVAGYPASRLVLTAIALLAVTALALATARRRPWLAVGWFWYLGMLVPVCGLLVQVGSQAMADRYTYLPLVGVFLMLAWGLPDLLPSRPWRGPALAAAGAAWLLVLAPLARVQADSWKNSEVLFRHGVAAVPGNWPAHHSLGIVLARRGEIEEAVAQFQTTLEIEPEFPKAHFNLGLARARQGRPEEAILQYREALRFDPGYVRARYNLASLLLKQGRPGEAVEHLERLIAREPRFAGAHLLLARALRQLGREAESASHESLARWYRTSGGGPDGPDQDGEQ